MSQLKWTPGWSEVSRDIIAKAEREFGVKFPEDYIECALKNHGGYPNYDVLDVSGVEVTFNRLLSYNPEDSSHIVDVYERIQDRLVEGVYPFARDDFGNFFCFDYRKGKEKSPIIAFWDHEEAFLDKEKGVTYVCDSFSEFLSKLRS